MRTERQTVATTHVDRHGERLTRPALESLVRQLRANYIPIGYEHDPRFPPLGRMIGATIVELPDGELAAEAEIQYWDSDPTTLAVASDSREIPRLVTSQPFVLYDRSVQAWGAIDVVNEIGTLLGSTPVIVAKKGLDPIAVLTLGLGVFAFAGIAQGFLSRLGEDLYVELKGKLARLYERRKRPSLLQIVLSTSCGTTEYVELVVIVESPSAEVAAGLLDRVLPALDVEMPEISLRLERLRFPRRVVFAWRREKLMLLHIVDLHGVPIDVMDLPPVKTRRRWPFQGRESRAVDLAPLQNTEAADASSLWRAFDVVLVQDAASSDPPTLAPGPADE